MTVFVSSSQNSNQGVIHCTCNWQYVPGDPESVHEHAKQHAEFDRVVSITGRTPATYEAREAMTADAPAADPLTAAERRLDRLSERSYDNAIQRGFGVEHPTPEQYKRLAAETDVLCDAAISATLLRKYAHVARPGGTIEGTEWVP